LVLLCERGEGAAGSVDGRVAYRENGDEDYDVHDGGQDGDSRVIDGNNEGAGFRCSAFAS